MNVIPILFCASTLAPASSAAPDTAQAPLRLSLTQAVEQALEANPETRRAREQVEELNHLVREARAEALPQVDFEARWVRSRDPGLRNSPFFSRLLEGPEALDPDALGAFSFDNYAWNFSLEQPLYTFGRVGGALKAARNELEGVRTDVRTAELRLARDVALSWYDLLLAERRLEVLASERAARERQLQQVQDRLDVEDATRLELLNARVALANLQPRVVAARSAIRVALARVNETLGRPAAEPLQVDGDLGLPDPLPRVPDPPQLLRRADRGRPELRRFELSRNVLEAAEQVTGADVKPEISANASYGIDTFDTGNLTDLSFRNWRFGVTVRWTLFDGLRTPAAVGQLRSQRRQSELQEQSFRAALARELEQAHGNWLGAVEALQVSELAVETAAEAQRVAEESYNWGAVTFLDVLEAGRALREAELTRAEAQHVGQVALATIKYLVGLRPDADAVELLPAPVGTSEERP